MIAEIMWRVSPLLTDMLVSLESKCVYPEVLVESLESNTCSNMPLVSRRSTETDRK